MLNYEMRGNAWHYLEISIIVVLLNFELCSTFHDHLSTLKAKSQTFSLNVKWIKTERIWECKLLQTC